MCLFQAMISANGVIDAVSCCCCAIGTTNNMKIKEKNELEFFQFTFCLFVGIKQITRFIVMAILIYFAIHTQIYICFSIHRALPTDCPKFIQKKMCRHQIVLLTLFANLLLFLCPAVAADEQQQEQPQKIIGGEEPEERLPYRQYVSEQNYVRE